MVEISSKTIDFLDTVFQLGYPKANAEIEKKTGIVDFLLEGDEIPVFQSLIHNRDENPNKVEYGDFQTPYNLTDIVCQEILTKDCSPSTIVEPTCGRGSFIISALKTFPEVKRVVGIEIYKPYLDEAKLLILDYMIESNTHCRVEFYHQNVFDFQFHELFDKLEKVLVIGNPPWVTNSVLGVLESGNVPLKSNFKNLNGFDAITGKSNFDISEYILIQLIKAFQDFDGCISFLVKNSVVKNILFDQKNVRHKIGNIEMQRFDAKKEFNVSVEASNFYCSFNSDPGYSCQTIDLYTKEELTSFGWTDHKFVSDIDGYESHKSFDGESEIVWRSGVKHDCSKVFEIQKTESGYTNKLNEEFELEDDIVYPLLKSSDIKGGIISKSRLFIIATQKKVGDNTDYIKDLPKTYEYLSNHGELLSKRGSSIYKNRPEFSIFGIGDYTYKPYKVAISGLYKKPSFSLILPSEDNKPILLDDTCYCISFDELIPAYITYKLLNHPETQKFLASIVFLDAKRPYSKDILMRLDLSNIYDSISYSEIEFDDGIQVSQDDWDSYLESLGVKTSKTLFD